MMNTTAERTALTDWLIAQILEMETVCDEIPFGLDGDDAMQLAALRIALASLLAKPVGEMVRFTDRVTGAVSEWKLSKNICGDTAGFQYRTETRPVYDAPPAPVMQPDELRMNYLVSKVVNVRGPLPYGSNDLFWSQQVSDDSDPNYATDLREQVDAAIRAAGGQVEG